MEPGEAAKASCFGLRKPPAVKAPGACRALLGACASQLVKGQQGTALPVPILAEEVQEEEAPTKKKGKKRDEVVKSKARNLIRDKPDAPKPAGTRVLGFTDMDWEDWQQKRLALGVRRDAEATHRCRSLPRVVMSRHPATLPYPALVSRHFLFGAGRVAALLGAQADGQRRDGSGGLGCPLEPCGPAVPLPVVHPRVLGGPPHDVGPLVSALTCHRPCSCRVLWRCATCTRQRAAHGECRMPPARP